MNRGFIVRLATAAGATGLLVGLSAAQGAATSPGLLALGQLTSAITHPFKSIPTPANTEPTPSPHPSYSPHAFQTPVNTDPPRTYPTPTNSETPHTYPTPTNTETPHTYPTPTNTETPHTYPTPTNTETPHTYPTPTYTQRPHASPSPSPAPTAATTPSPSSTVHSGFLSTGDPGNKVFNPSVGLDWTSYYTTATIELDSRPSAYMYFRYQDDNHTYICSVSRGSIQLVKLAPNTELTVLSATTFTWVPGTEYNLTVGGKATQTIGCGVTPVGGNGNAMVAVTPVVDSTYAAGTTAIQGSYKGFYATKLT